MNIIYFDRCYPYLYHSIKVDHSFSRKTPFLANMSVLRQTLAESPHLALLVHEFIVPFWPGIEDLADIFPRCVNLVSLLAWNEEPDVLDLSNNKALRRLSCPPTLYPELTRGSPVPQILLQLTHLEILSPPEDSLTWYSVLARLKNLTHFFTELPDPYDTPLEPLINHLPPNLRICILCAWTHVDDLARLKQIASGEVDQRVVFLSDRHTALEIPHIFLRHSQLVGDWGRYWIRESYWDKAESIIKNRAARLAID